MKMASNSFKINFLEYLAKKDGTFRMALFGESWTVFCIKLTIRPVISIGNVIYLRKHRKIHFPVDFKGHVLKVP